jgi:hypothetical protein
VRVWLLLELFRDIGLAADIPPRRPPGAANAKAATTAKPDADGGDRRGEQEKSHDIAEE